MRSKLSQIMPHLVILRGGRYILLSINPFLHFNDMSSVCCCLSLS
ncbi:hypothetical protein BVRB_040450, partial [Beta vulgaris subsp. vulgaris]